MRALALVLVFVLSPGAAEVTEDLAHYLAEGHTLHAAVVANAAHEDHEDHEQGHADDEHGCSALFHVCGCHSPAPSLISAALTIERAAELMNDVADLVPHAARRPVDGVAAETFRPPIA